MPPSCLSSKVQESTLKNKLNNALLDRSAEPLKGCYFCSLPRHTWCFLLFFLFVCNRLYCKMFSFFLQKAEMKLTLWKLNTLIESVEFTHNVRGGRILGCHLLNQALFLLKMLVLLLLAKSKPISMK